MYQAMFDLYCLCKNKGFEVDSLKYLKISHFKGNFNRNLFAEMPLSTFLVELINHPAELACKPNNGNYPKFCVCSQLLKDGDNYSRETSSSVVPENEIYLVLVVSS